MSTENEVQIDYCESYKRGLAAMIDVAIVFFLRVFAAQILAVLWVQAALDRLRSDFSLYFKTDVIETRQHVEFILAHESMKDYIIFLILILLVGAIYHSYFNSSSWKATIGKRIMSVMILDKNFAKIGFIRGVFHYFLSIVPIVILLYLFTFSASYGGNLISAVTYSAFNIAISVLAVIWVNFHVFSKQKLTLYDLISGTVFIDGRSGASKPWQKLNEDDI